MYPYSRPTSLLKRAIIIDKKNEQIFENRYIILYIITILTLAAVILVHFILTFPLYKPDDLDFNDHEYFMAKCIEVALLAKRRGDSPVGSVIIQDGVIISHGMEGGKTHKDITYHAEIEAIRQATLNLNTWDLSNCIMYTTHEPCIMCSYVIRFARIKIVVVGISTGNIGGYSSKYPLLLDTSIENWGPPPVIITGILQKECESLSSPDV